jgi:hypothetical protein
MVRHPWTYFLIWASALTLAGCASTPQSVSHNGGLVHERNQGYSLLYKLMTDEANVSKLLILKHADEPLAGLVKEISAFCQSAKDQMDAFAKGDSRIEYDMTDLPVIEQESRDQTAKEDGIALLTSGGKEFELRLVFTQAQAMDYAAEVSSALAKHEDDPARQRFLKGLTVRYADFHRRLMELLTVQL